MWCSQFKELLYRRGRAVFFAFDLVWLDSVDLRQTPLVERKKKLKGLIERSECSEILYGSTRRAERQTLRKCASES